MSSYLADHNPLFTALGGADNLAGELALVLLMAAVVFALLRRFRTAVGLLCLAYAYLTCTMQDMSGYSPVTMVLASTSMLVLLGFAVAVMVRGKRSIVWKLLVSTTLVLLAGSSATLISASMLLRIPVTYRSWGVWLDIDTYTWAAMLVLAVCLVAIAIAYVFERILLTRRTAVTK